MNRFLSLFLFAMVSFLQASYAKGKTPETNSAVASVSGLTVMVDPFQVDSFSFAGGNIDVLANGTWFVGVDLYRNTLIALPRLGHRGWVPLARVITGGSSITSFEQIVPVLPASRIPRALQKIRNGQPLNVVVMGSSLAEGSGTNKWSGMLFGASSNIASYKILNIGTFANVALGGTANQYILAQLGYAWPSGRSSLLNNVDLVVLTCLANGGDYRLSIIEPVIRDLRKSGVEVILLTDNPQNPASTYAGMQGSLLYPDGTEVMRIADLYGVELADTAAYVFEQQLRYGSGIYLDTIHMTSVTAAGPTVAQPSGGHEIYARAIRSIIPLSYQTVATLVNNSDFSDGVQGFTPYSGGAVTQSNGKLNVLKATANTRQWGGQIAVPPLKMGDKIRVQGTWAFVDGYSGTNIQVGMQGGGAGWGSTVESPAPGVFDVTVTVIRDIPSDGRMLFFANKDNAPINSTFSLDNVLINFNPHTAVIDLTPGRAEEAIPLPPARVLTDYKVPNDSIVTLPKDEIYNKTNHADHGTLGSHPAGANSFARRSFPSVSAAEDLLTVTSGQKAVINGISAVGFSMIRYAGATDVAVTVQVRRNNTLLKTISLGAGYDREEYIEILTPTEYGKLPPVSNDSIELTIASGTLRICGLVALNNDHAFPVTYWAADQGLFGSDALPSATPFGDGVSNLLKYAFNIPLDGPRLNHFDPAAGTGSYGLPIFSINSADAVPTFRVQFLHRRGSDLSYVPERSTNLVDFTPMLAPPAVTPINTDWEMITVDDVVGTSVSSGLFGRLKVTQP